MNGDLKKIEKIAEYVDLGKRLLDVVDDEHSSLVSDFITSLESYKKGLLEAQKLNTIYLMKTAKVDQKMASLETAVLKVYDGDVEKTKAYIFQLSKQSNRQRYWRSVGNSVFYGILSALFSVFSLEKSRETYELCKNYQSAVKNISETMKIVARTNIKKTEALQLSSKIEIEQARISKKLQNEGIDEKVADIVSINPEKLAFAYFDYLKKEYYIE